MNQHQRSGRRPVTPLYDARYEHDACGVGFVADAGGRSRDRVLPLALAGLAALGHRGAFGADGESSDGAGVALPLDRSLLELLAGDAARRPARRRLAVPATWPCRRGAGARLRRGRPRRGGAVDRRVAGRAGRPGRAGLRGRPVAAGVRPGDRGPAVALGRRPAPPDGRRLRTASRRRPTPARSGCPRGGP